MKHYTVNHFVQPQSCSSNIKIYQSAHIHLMLNALQLFSLSLSPLSLIISFVSLLFLLRASSTGTATSHWTRQSWLRCSTLVFYKITLLLRVVALLDEWRIIDGNLPNGYEWYSHLNIFSMGFNIANSIAGACFVSCILDRFIRIELLPRDTLKYKAVVFFQIWVVIITLLNIFFIMTVNVGFLVTKESASSVIVLLSQLVTLVNGVEIPTIEFIANIRLVYSTLRTSDNHSINQTASAAVQFKEGRIILWRNRLLVYLLITIFFDLLDVALFVTATTISDYGNVVNLIAICIESMHFFFSFLFLDILKFGLEDIKYSQPSSQATVTQSPTWQSTEPAAPNFTQENSLNTWLTTTTITTNTALSHDPSSKILQQTHPSIPSVLLGSPSVIYRPTNQG